MKSLFGMKTLQLTAAVILIFLGSLFLIISVLDPCQGALLSAEGCLSVTYQQFRTFFPLGAVFLSIAVVVLFMGRTKIPAVPISKPARKAGA